MVRDRVRKIIGKVSVGKVTTVQHPAISRLIAEDGVRRQKQPKASYISSSDKPVFDSSFEQRRLRLLNALFIATAKCGGRPEVDGRDAREIRMKIHQTTVPVSLDRSSAARGKGTGQGHHGPDQLRFAILARYERDQVRASW